MTKEIYHVKRQQYYLIKTEIVMITESKMRHLAANFGLDSHVCDMKFA